MTANQDTLLLKHELHIAQCHRFHNNTIPLCHNSKMCHNATDATMPQMPHCHHCHCNQMHFWLTIYFTVNRTVGEPSILSPAPRLILFEKQPFYLVAINAMLVSMLWSMLLSMLLSMLVSMLRSMSPFLLFSLPTRGHPSFFIFLVYYRVIWTNFFLLFLIFGRFPNKQLFSSYWYRVAS